MDGDLLLIFAFITIALVITGFTVNGIVAKVLDFKKSQNSGLTGPSDSAAGQLAERTEMIEDRVRVLERLATDRGQLLSDEIEALRDASARNKESAAQ